ncbi:MAG: hypothetical protein BGO11_19635 [Solirubrobacterales bacterium 70-9]|nr:MAG: hypothetical protein BGO11_19635 [Solirubrobacterales bacterium 70-9]
MSGGGRIYAPTRAQVGVDARGVPDLVEGLGVEAIREDWLVEDRWWTDAPLRRHYWELVLADGRDVVVFCDLETGGWFRQPS